MEIEEYIKQCRTNGLKHLRDRIAHMEKIGFDSKKLKVMKEAEKEKEKLIKDTYGTLIRS